MKKIFLYIVIIIGSLNSISFTTSDYRDSFCGNYNCIRIRKHLNERKQIVLDTSNCVLKVSKTELDSSLLILISDKTYEVKLKNKSIFGHTNYCSGKFKNDSIEFVYVPSKGPEAFKYIGKK
jgi:hypothetical protein